MKIVTVCGSLRAGSSNEALLRAAAALAPDDVEWLPFAGLGALPHFNPDLDVEPAPPTVAAMRALFGAADGVVISTPEYAHNLPGTLKNGLDWLVSSGELYEKPVLLLNAAPVGGQRAQASLTQTLAVMTARVLPQSLTEPFLEQKLTLGGRIDGDAGVALRGALHALAVAARAKND